MECSPSSASFFASPTGHYLRSRGLAFWCERPALWGVTAWGALTLEHAEQLSRWIDEEYAHPHPPYVTLLDFRRVSNIEDTAFTAWTAFFERTRTRRNTRVQRAALVRPSAGMLASTLAGFPRISGVDVPWLVTDELDGALEWLAVPGLTGMELPRVLAALEQMATEAMENPSNQRSTLDALRDRLDRDVRASIEDVADDLRLSVRTLQRQLKTAQTSFEAELLEARVRRAQRLLRDTPDKLATIALEAGFASQAHFSVVFRRITGENPSAYRKRQTRA
ncbi:MAG: helix-turn-helix transcriptional regulator [Polyangiaceae bacterium]